MKYVALTVAIAAAIAGGYYFHVPQKLLAIVSKNKGNIHLSFASPAPKPIDLPKTASNSPQMGQVAGISTQAKETGSDLLQKGVAIGKTMSTFFLSTPTSSSDSIEVGKVMNQISKQVENIPSTLLDQAKVEYCKQVLVEATKSGTNK